jgi:hypothetical protein
MKKPYYPINVRVDESIMQAINREAARSTKEKADVMRLALGIGLHAMSLLDQDPDSLVVAAAISRLIEKTEPG